MKPVRVKRHAHEIRPAAHHRQPPWLRHCAQPVLPRRGAGPDRAWLADITYCATEDGRHYLAAIKDMTTEGETGVALIHC